MSDSPRNTRLNWTIPAFVKSNVGSSAGTSEELGRTACPRARKYSRKWLRISAVVMVAMVFAGREPSGGDPPGSEP
jgi:hypothetical protein